QLRGAAFGNWRAAALAGFARAVDLQHALAGGEIPRRRHFLEQRLDVRAQELERPVAALADEMEMPRMQVRVLEAEAPLAEIDLARDAGVDHPLQRAVDRRAADPLVLGPDEIEEIVGRQVPLLAQEHVDDQVALAGPLAPGRPEALEIGSRRVHVTRHVPRADLRRPASANGT